jgi:hypothetical protein
MLINFLSICLQYLNLWILKIFPDVPWMGYGLVIFGVVFFIRNLLQKGPLPHLKRAIYFPVFFTAILFALHSAVTLSVRL